MILPLLTLLCGVCASAVAANAASTKQNILFLFADDQRADTIGELGNPVASKNSCGPSVIEFLEAPGAFTGLDLSGGAAYPVYCCQGPSRGCWRTE